MCEEVWELKHPSCLPSGTVLLARCIPLIGEKPSLKKETTNHCSCRTGGVLRGFQDPSASSEGGERLLPSHAHRPICPDGPALTGMSEPVTHPRPCPCRIAAFQHIFNSGFKQFFFFGWGNVSSGPSKPYIVIPIDCVDWHLAGKGQSQESGVRATRPTKPLMSPADVPAASLLPGADASLVLFQQLVT